METLIWQVLSGFCDEIIVKNCKKIMNLTAFGYVLHKYNYAGTNLSPAGRSCVNKMTKHGKKIRQNVNKIGSETVFIKIDNRKKLCNNLVSKRSESF